MRQICVSCDLSGVEKNIEFFCAACLCGSKLRLTRNRLSVESVRLGGGVVIGCCFFINEIMERCYSGKTSEAIGVTGMIGSVLQTRGDCTCSLRDYKGNIIVEII